ncbi:GIY-YIG nuclease family protein [Belliella kenyensis]|nr:GIY-YIG nuclease family protein [Belliella kenyensis]MCH7400430.1 GIY-YIG nuclease family protein [Belliella kenyensis]MDN3604553.1 GIY-YIG nuclease family protein [Belliella kenyensis]
MDTYCVYILYSKSVDRYYIGYSIDMLSRLDQHNRHVFKGAFTDRAEDWEIFHTIVCMSERQAKLIEKHIKKNKSRTYLENLKKHPEISIKLLEKY